MLNANEVNSLLEAFFAVVETKVPALGPLSVSEPTAITTSGAYGSVILGALFTGDLEGKLTLTLDWETAYLIAEALTQTRSEGFGAESQRALEGLFQETLNDMGQRLLAVGRNTQARALPLLMDADVLLSEDGRPSAIRLALTHESDRLNLYLAMSGNQ